jgi:hypothetical protein
MKRRTFIATTTIAAIGLPVAYYIKKRISKGNPVTTTALLSHFCDERELKEIGAAYRTLVPAENEKQKLTDLILTTTDGKKLNASDWSHIEDLVSQKVHEDFLNHKVIIVKGWVISTTEARQCALFSLT